MTEEDFVAFTQVVFFFSVILGDQESVFWATAKAEFEVGAFEAFFGQAVCFLHAKWAIVFHYFIQRGFQYVSQFIVVKCVMVTRINLAVNFYGCSMAA